MNPTLRALNRFGLGARPGEPGRVRDPRAWLATQLDAPPTQLDDPAREEREELADSLGEVTWREANADPELRRAMRARLNAIRNAETDAVLDERVGSNRPFVERLVAFWSNHLCVSTAANGPLSALAGPYEREAVRPHVLGRFDDMVLASARHPAMLLYLDNAVSIGPDSPAGRLTGRRGAERGLNENYGRELLELHTLGVDGGYTQEDVQEVARALTGWTIGHVRPLGLRERRTPADLAAGFFGFVFRARQHQPGARTVLGRRYTQRGVELGEAVIRDLCAHPSTSRFVASKLVRHFVSDDPPARAVDVVSSEFSASGGDLKRVAEALIGLPEAWDPANRKLRTPQDWLTAVLRGIGARQSPGNLTRPLLALRHPLWAPPAPKGWGDTRREWSDPDSLMNRAELARTLATRFARRVEAADLLELVDVADSDPLHALIGDETVDGAERIALALASPAFQWR